MLLFLSLVAFALVLALPAIPSMLEVARPKDDRRLAVAVLYIRDARWFGRAFRERLAPFLADARGAADARAELRLRTDEDTHWAPDLTIAPLERLRGIGVGERVVVGHGAGIRDAYALQDLNVEDGVVARTLMSDDTLRMGDSVRVLRWIDAEGDIDVGADSDLGLSASGGARVRLGERVRFERVWGSPVMSVTRAAAPFVLDRHARTVVDAKLVAAGESVVLHGPARVARRTYVPMDLKVHGSLAIEAGVHVGGNVIARGDVTVASDVSLGGNIFAEGDIRLGPGTRVGRAGAAKTVYATGQVLVADNVEVFGWIVSEKGGQTL